MRIAIHTLGTRGDVQPYLALALGLKAAGHDVQISAPSQFEAFIGTHGIRFAHLPGEFLELMDTPDGKAAMAGGRALGAGLRLMKRLKPAGRRLLDAQWSSAREFGPELVLFHPKAMGAPHIAEKLGCPAVLAAALPGFTPTREFPSPLFPLRTLGPLNALTHLMTARGGDAMFGSVIRAWRAELGLPNKPGQWAHPAATIYGYSPLLLPVPPDWPPSVAVTGSWILHDEETEGWQPDPELRDFLDAGDAPVYVGFGSMPAISPARLTALVMEALDLSGRRGILATGGGAMGPVTGDSNVISIAGAPHERLFQLVAACVHHGGSGSTAASLRAGKPTVVCPFFGDQPFWGRKVHELGVGPAPVPQRWLTPESLAAAIGEATTNVDMQRRAAELGLRMSQEDGVRAAISFLRSRGLLP